jgi:hypothetical protein
MFNLFHTKTKREQLQDKYDDLMSQVFDLEFTNIRAAEEKRIKAQQVMMKIVELDRMN